MANVDPACPDPDTRTMRPEDLAAVHEEVGRLPERYRRAVVLCHFEGLTRHTLKGRLEVHRAGDCVAPRRAGNAVQEGYQVALSL